MVFETPKMKKNIKIRRKYLNYRFAKSNPCEILNSHPGGNFGSENTHSAREGGYGKELNSPLGQNWSSLSDKILVSMLFSLRFTHYFAGNRESSKICLKYLRRYFLCNRALTSHATTLGDFLRNLTPHALKCVGHKILEVHTTNIRHLALL